MIEHLHVPSLKKGNEVCYQFINLKICFYISCRFDDKVYSISSLSINTWFIFNSNCEKQRRTILRNTSRMFTELWRRKYCPWKCKQIIGPITYWRWGKNVYRFVIQTVLPSENVSKLLDLLPTEDEVRIFTELWPSSCCD